MTSIEAVPNVIELLKAIESEAYVYLVLMIDPLMSLLGRILRTASQRCGTQGNMVARVCTLGSDRHSGTSHRTFAWKSLARFNG